MCKQCRIQRLDGITNVLYACKLDGVRKENGTEMPLGLAAVEDGILPPEMGTVHAEVTAKSARKFAGQDARLYGRRDARRYAKQIRATGAYE